MTDTNTSATEAYAHFVNFTAASGERYTVRVDETSGIFCLVHIARTGTEKARYFVHMRDSEHFVCDPKFCAQAHYGASCEHLQIVQTLLSYKPPAYGSYPCSTAMKRIDDAMKRGLFVVTAFVPELKSLIYSLRVQYLEEIRLQQTSDYVHVFEEARPYLESQDAQCIRCMLSEGSQFKCVDGVRRGMACLSAILWERLPEEDQEYYRQIPLLRESLDVLPFASLLILCHIYRVNFSTVFEFSQVALRGRLLLCSTDFPYVLTV